MKAKRRAGAAPNTSGEVWVSVVSYKRKYYISRTDIGPQGRIDDEAQLEIVATAEAITRAQKKHLGETMYISLLCAQGYSEERPTVSAFFASITLRGSQRTALAYLPPTPFWELPAVISQGATWLCLGWSSMHRGYADLTSVFVGDETELGQFGTTCVRRSATTDASLERAL